MSSGQMVGGTAESTTINKNGRQVIWSSGMARDTLIYAGGDQTVHGEAHNTRLEGVTSMYTTVARQQRR